MGRDRRGQGKAGGGLKARIRDYQENLAKLGTGYTKPGSQNAKKGGRGK